MLTPEDQDILATAIRRGMSAEPPSWKSILVSVLVLVVVGGALVVSYQILHRWRPATALAISSSQTTTMRQFTLEGAPAVAWQVTPSYVGSFVVTGPETTPLEVDLPVPATSCASMATAFGPSAQCVPSSPGSDPSLAVPSPLTITWNSPTPVQLLTSSNGVPPSSAGSFHYSSTLGVTVTAPGAAMSSPASPSVGSASTPAPTAAMGTAAASSVTLLASAGSDPQRWCFGSPLSSNNLQVSRGSSQWTQLVGSENDFQCGSGLRVRVGTPGTRGQPPAVTLGNVASFQLVGHSTEIAADAFEGTVHLTSVSSTVLGTPTELVARSKTSAPMHTVLVQKAANSMMTVDTKAATSVLTDDGNLVSSLWDRQQVIALPILLAICGALAPLFLATISSMTMVHRRRHHPSPR